MKLDDPGFYSASMGKAPHTHTHITHAHTHFKHHTHTHTLRTARLNVCMGWAFSRDLVFKASWKEMGWVCRGVKNSGDWVKGGKNYEMKFFKGFNMLKFYRGKGQNLLVCVKNAGGKISPG